SCYASARLPALPSFPTRRSSDLLSSPRSEGLDEGAIDAVVELEAILEVGRARGGGGEVDLHVVGGGELRVGDADEVAAAEILDLGDFTLGFGDDGFDAIDELIDGVFLAAVVENEGRAVVAFGSVHWVSLRLSWFMARSAPCSIRRRRPAV